VTTGPAYDGCVFFLVVLFVVFPLVELAVIIQVGQWIGVLDTLALLLVLSVGGAWIVKRQGLGVLRRIRGEVAAGGVPTAALIDGALIGFAGVLLLAPGFVTDAFGLLLLLPPVRGLMRVWLRRRFAVRATRRGPQGPHGGYPEIDV
jgi:UPF0716 protein FxsA